MLDLECSKCKVKEVEGLDLSNIVKRNKADFACKGYKEKITPNKIHKLIKRIPGKNNPKQNSQVSFMLSN